MATAAKIRSPFTAAEWSALRECQRILHRWAELECNGAIQYDDDGSARRYWPDRYGSPTLPGSVVPDKSEAAMERARKIAAKHGLSVYNQTDPRGCALYVYSASDLKNRRIDECYSTLARAVI
jgi:hypothetical protein